MSAARWGLAAVAVALVSGTAHADRAMVWTVGVTLDDRTTGPSYTGASNSNGTMLGGARAMLAFEDDPLAYPGDGTATDFRLVPELLTGFVADSVHAEGYVGAGLRGELDLAVNKRAYTQRTAFYVAARAIAIGKHQDGAMEGALGEYLSRHNDASRFGWEGTAMVRPQADDAPAGTREVDALINIYCSWR